MRRIYWRAFLLAVVVSACEGRSCEPEGCGNFHGCTFNLGTLVDAGRPPPSPDMVCTNPSGNCDPKCPSPKPSVGDYCERPNLLCTYIDLALFCEVNQWVIDCPKSAPKWCTDLSSPDDFATDDSAPLTDGDTDDASDAADQID